MNARPVLSAGPAPTLVTVIGEALIDLVPTGNGLTFDAHPGGSPFNVAVGLARLGVDTALMARLAGNAFGQILRAHAGAEGIDLRAAPRASEATTLAVVSFDADARASYDFYFEGTADWQWTAGEVAAAPPGTAVLHFGSIASWTAPGDQRIAELAARLHESGQVLVSYDPNIRPLLLGDPAHGRAMVERSLRAAHLAKASTEDVAWLYPDRPPDEVARHWLDLGVRLVVLTDGPDGATALAASGPALARPGRSVAVADTVGAGDSFTAAFLASLVGRGITSPQALSEAAPDQLTAVLDDAILASALTCERTGADPPTTADLDAARSRFTFP